MKRIGCEDMKISAELVKTVTFDLLKIRPVSREVSSDVRDCRGLSKADDRRNSDLHFAENSACVERSPVEGERSSQDFKG